MDEEIEEKTDIDTLAEIDLFFRMAIELENNKFNLYPKQAEKMQLKCIELILQRLEFFEFEED
jgi:hypothetical protein